MSATMQNVDKALMDALNPLLPGCVFPSTYTGPALEYIVTDHTSLPQACGENGPAAARYLVTVRYYLPHGKNPNPMKALIGGVLYGHGFTWPSITPGHDELGQCWIFECEYVNAGGVYGYS